MTWIPRKTLEKTIRERRKAYPALFITGPRQSGKTAIIQKLYPEHAYVSFQDVQSRTWAQQDPEAFLSQHPEGVILDDLQRYPPLLLHLKPYVERGMGSYVLISTLPLHIPHDLQRYVTSLTVLPLSWQEQRPPHTLEQTLFRGSYPDLALGTGLPRIWYSRYVDHYLERDVRDILHVRDIVNFQRFMGMCALRIGQPVNTSALAADCGITHNTAKAWLGVLEASHMVYLLPLYPEHFNKRPVKAPKLCFYDTGLAAWLQGIQKADDLIMHPMRGPLFESAVVSDLIKARYHQGESPDVYFWRDRSRHQVDLVIKRPHRLLAVEILASQSIPPDGLRHLHDFAALAGPLLNRSYVVYAGKHQHVHQGITAYPWHQLEHIV